MHIHVTPSTAPPAAPLSSPPRGPSLGTAAIAAQAGAKAAFGPSPEHTTPQCFCREATCRVVMPKKTLPTLKMLWEGKRCQPVSQAVTRPEAPL